MQPTPEDQAGADEPVFVEVLDAADVLPELPDDSRRAAWASSVLGVWAEDPRSAEIDTAFLEWLVAATDPRAASVHQVVAALIDARDGDAVATRAWVVAEGDGRSVGIGFQLSDGSEHSLLADLYGGELASVVVAPGPEELFDGAEDVVAPEALEVGAAAAEVVEGWSRLAAGGTPIPDSVFVNGALARARLRHLVESDVQGFGRGRETSSDEDPIDPGERSELNEWAVSVLDGAGVGPGMAGPAELTDPLDPRRISTYPAAEQEAFRALEWADWLGVVLGLVRSPAGTVVEPTMLIDLVNRCPEVTSAIPKKDRSYLGIAEVDDRAVMDRTRCARRPASVDRRRRGEAARRTPGRLGRLAPQSSPGPEGRDSQGDVRAGAGDRCAGGHALRVARSHHERRGTVGAAHLAHVHQLGVLGHRRQGRLRHCGLGRRGRAEPDVSTHGDLGMRRAAGLVQDEVDVLVGPGRQVVIVDHRCVDLAEADEATDVLGVERLVCEEEGAARAGALGHDRCGLGAVERERVCPRGAVGDRADRTEQLVGLGGVEAVEVR